LIKNTQKKQRRRRRKEGNLAFVKQYSVPYFSGSLPLRASGTRHIVHPWWTCKKNKMNE